LRLRGQGDSPFCSPCAICLPYGLAAAHFRWPERNLTLLRTQLNLLIWPLALAVVIVIVNVAIGLDPKETGGTLAKLGLLLGYGPLSWFLFRVFHPRRGVLAHLRAGGEYPMVFRTYLIWYPLAVGYPSGYGVRSFIMTSRKTSDTETSSPVSVSVTTTICALSYFVAVVGEE